MAIRKEKLQCDLGNELEGGRIESPFHFKFSSSSIGIASLCCTAFPYIELAEAFGFGI